jgi:mycofactocin precursor
MAETVSVPTDEAPLTEDIALVEETAPQIEASTEDEWALDEEFEEELIIEDFTIDGICGVY